MCLCLVFVSLALFCVFTSIAKWKGKTPRWRHKWDLKLLSEKSIRWRCNTRLFKSYADCLEVLMVQVQRPLHQVLIIQSWTKEAWKRWACAWCYTRCIPLPQPPVRGAPERCFLCCSGCLFGKATLVSFVLFVLFESSVYNDFKAVISSLPLFWRKHSLTKITFSLFLINC